MSFLDRLFYILLWPLPQRALSRLMAVVAGCRWRWLKGPLITLFVKRYRVAVDLARPPSLAAYASLNDFFTRAIHLSARPMETAPDLLASPADGTISQCGAIARGELLQAKGRTFSTGALLADGSLATAFQAGSFCTIYLSPRDYHRVHMPCAGRLLAMTYLPGRLFSVQARTARAVPDLYARNERLVLHWRAEEGPLQGRDFVVVLVGALLVSGMSTVWHGQVNPHGQRGSAWTRTYQAQEAPMLAKGAELGHFSMGSTVILLLPRPVAWAAHSVADAPVLVRATLGRFAA